MTTPTSLNTLKSGPTPAFLDALARIVGSRNVLVTPADQRAYECDACLLVQAPPEVIVLPANTQQVADVVRLCNAHAITFTPRGAGTGTSGGALAIEGGVLIALSRLNAILAIEPQQRWARVQPGVVNAWLNEALAEHQLFYAPDPSSQQACTLGGNVAENAGGIHCLKYGVTSDHVLGLTLVLPSGEVLTLGGVTRQSPDNDLMGLVIGSEGTLGIVTEMTVRVMPKPIETRVWLIAFKHMDAAAHTVQAILSAGLLPAALEMMDAFTVRCVNDAFDVGFPESAEAVLLIELDGSSAWVQTQAQKLEALLDALPTGEIGMRKIAQSAQERTALWQARKGAVAAYGRLQPAFYVHDCVVPRSQLVNVLNQINAIAKQYAVPIGNVFHAGDGNLHPNILFNPADKAMTERVLAAGEAILEACVAAGGTLSGEHGIGLEKNQQMRLLYTEADLEAMQQVRRVFNPRGLCNPGKIFPTPKACSGHGMRATQLNANGLWV
ncbi:MAG: FAD-linked oxidase C-terminal domain-containing protein [Vampirovibrionales bacterium]|nr:FAD-linked oxidase C-terminal domain-containing protein [Vampirovibrionales bacterium]